MNGTEDAVTLTVGRAEALLLFEMLADFYSQSSLEAWAMDISYIPMARGLVYLAAVVDWLSRKILAWKLSITMDVSFRLEAVEEALSKYGKPEIFNTDQGSQFTSEAFTEQLRKNAIQISMDAAGATMSSWSGSGERSSTKRSTSGPTSRSRKREPPWANTSSSTTGPDPTPA